MESEGDLVHNDNCSEDELELREEIYKCVVDSKVEGGSCDVYLIGTIGVSQESCREFEAIINFLKPQVVVFLELCPNGISLLELVTLKVPTIAQIVEMWKITQNIFAIASIYILAKIASKVKVLPATDDFSVAFREALEFNKIKVILGDRPIRITLQRVWAKMPLWYKLKFLFNTMFHSFSLPNADEISNMLNEIENMDLVTLIIQELGKEFPSLMDPLLHERDQYMTSKLLEVARENSLVVAVVGKGHLQGIMNNWNQPINRGDLLEIPTNQSAFTVNKILFCLIAIAFVPMVFWCKS